MREVQERIGVAPIFVCGGTPRDRYLGHLENIEDLDLTNGTKEVDYLSQEFYIELRKKYRVSRVVATDGHSSINFGSFKMDFSSNFNAPNIEKLLLDRGIKNPTGMQKEIFSRDFTCNALLLSLDLKNLSDPTYRGFKDIKDRTIRTCLSPEITLTTNKNRVIRSIYLATKLDFDIDPAIVDFVKKNPQSVKISTNKVMVEKINKAFENDADRAAALISKMGLWEYIPISEKIQPYYTNRTKVAYFQGGGGINEPTPGKVKYKAEPAIVVQPRFKEPFYRNYDLYYAEGVSGKPVHSPGVGWHAMENYNSIKEYLEETRKFLRGKYVADDSYITEDNYKERASMMKVRATLISEISKTGKCNDTILRILLASKIDDLQLKYPNLDVKEISNHDPSGTNKYLEWICKQISNGYSKENLYTTLDFFHKNLSRFQSKDINSYKDLKDLENASKNVSEKSKSKEKRDIKSDAPKIYEDNEQIVVRPDTKQSCMAYGKGTKWCITMGDSSYYDQYTSMNIIFYFILSKIKSQNDPGSKVAISIRRNRNNKITKIEYFDATDKELSELEVSGMIKNFHNILGTCISDADKLPITLLDKRNEIRKAYYDAVDDDDSIGTIYSIAENLLTPTDVFVMLSKSDDSQVRQRVAKNTEATDEVLIRLSNDRDINVRWYVASNASVPAEAMEILSNDENGVVRHKVAENSSTPPNILAKLSEDKDDYVVAAVANNIHTPIDVLTRLSGVEDNYVKELAEQNLISRNKNGSSFNDRMMVRAELLSKLVKTSQRNFDLGKGLYENMDKYDSVKDFLGDENKLDFPYDDIESGSIIGNNSEEHEMPQSLGPAGAPFDTSTFPGQTNLGDFDTYPYSAQLGGLMDKYLPQNDFEGKKPEELDFGRDYSDGSEDLSGRCYETGEGELATNYRLEELIDKYLNPAPNKGVFGLPDGVGELQSDETGSPSGMNPYYGTTDMGITSYEDKWNI